MTLMKTLSSINFWWIHIFIEHPGCQLYLTQLVKFITHLTKPGAPGVDNAPGGLARACRAGRGGTGQHDRSGARAPRAWPNHPRGQLARERCRHACLPLSILGSFQLPLATNEVQKAKLPANIHPCRQSRAALEFSVQGSSCSRRPILIATKAYLALCKK